jgi:hypothetical protein
MYLKIKSSFISTLNVIYIYIYIYRRGKYLISEELIGKIGNIQAMWDIIEHICINSYIIKLK